MHPCAKREEDQLRNLFKKDRNVQVKSDTYYYMTPINTEHTFLLNEKDCKMPKRKCVSFVLFIVYPRPPPKGIDTRFIEVSPSPLSEEHYAHSDKCI